MQYILRLAGLGLRLAGFEGWLEKKTVNADDWQYDQFYVRRRTLENKSFHGIFPVGGDSNPGQICIQAFYGRRDSSILPTTSFIPATTAGAWRWSFASTLTLNAK